MKVPFFPIWEKGKKGKGAESIFTLSAPFSFFRTYFLAFHPHTTAKRRPYSLTLSYFKAAHSFIYV